MQIHSLGLMALRVTQYDEPILRKKGKRVENFDADLRTLADEMVQTMHEYEGAGLAAQQVGKDLQLFVVDISWHPELNEMPCMIDGRKPRLDLMMPMVFVNAEVETLPGDRILAEEGCLSFPDIRGEVPRAEAIRCRYHDIDGASHVMECADWLARVIQHEYDHTQGVLFIDRMNSRQLKKLDSRLRQLKHNTRDTLAEKSRQN